VLALYGELAFANFDHCLHILPHRGLAR
jgi:hypothetical protein